MWNTNKNKDKLLHQSLPSTISPVVPSPVPSQTSHFFLYFLVFCSAPFLAELSGMSHLWTRSRRRRSPTSYSLHCLGTTHRAWISPHRKPPHHPLPWLMWWGSLIQSSTWVRPDALPACLCYLWQCSFVSFVDGDWSSYYLIFLCFTSTIPKGFISINTGF